jgi:hypothetical protein
MGEKQDWTRWSTMAGTVVLLMTGWFAIKEVRALDDPRKGDTLSEATRAALRRLPAATRIPAAGMVCAGFIAFWVWFFVHIVFQGEGVL